MYFDCGSTRVGKRVDRRTVLGNGNVMGESLTVYHITVEGSDFSITTVPLPVTLKPDQEVPMHIIFKPSRIGKVEGRMLILTDSQYTSSHTNISVTNLGGTGY